MGWRTIVISHNAKLDYQMGYLVVRGQETVRVHINEIDTLLIESTAVSLTTFLLCELVKQKIKVVFCDEKRNPSSELIPYYGCHDTSLKIRNQINWDQRTKALVWTEIVAEKIRKQAETLEMFNRIESAQLVQYIEELEVGDITNREGHAAKVYFNSLFGKAFSRTEECPINAALNYGYSILLSQCTKEIVANGYITQLGLFHDNMFNYFNLASDLMEPFRPIVDRKVKNMCLQVFEKDEKRAVLTILYEELYISGKCEVLANAIKIYIRSVFDALNDNDASLIKFYKNEL